MTSQVDRIALILLLLAMLCIGVSGVAFMHAVIYHHEPSDIVFGFMV